MTGAASAAPSRIHSIHIYFTPQEDQRYPTLGDWQVIDDGATLRITVTQQPDQLMSWPLVIHELTEAMLCIANGISQEVVDEWDITGPGKDSDDPGALPDAPYFEQHMQATKLEELMVEYLDLDIEEYTMATTIGASAEEETPDDNAE